VTKKLDNRPTGPLDDNYVWSQMEDQDFLPEDQTSEKVVQAAKFKARYGYDTEVAGRKTLVCLDCVTGILADAEIPVPKTSSIPTFKDALRGYKVELWDHVRADGSFERKRYGDHKSWTEIKDFSDLQSGDVVFVKSVGNDGSRGEHAVLVTGTHGDGTKASNIWSGSQGGIDIVHDKGSSYPILNDHYSWGDLLYGNGGGNRMFQTAFRYNYKESE